MKGMYFILLVAIAAFIGCNEKRETEVSNQDNIKNADSTNTPRGSITKIIIADVKHWTYNIQQVSTSRQHEQLVGSHFDMYVLEPTRSQQGDEDFDIKGLVAQIREFNKTNYQKDPIILAYIDIAQAEDWRWYWQSGWKIGNPEWILGDDPNGWEGCYPVAYWNTQWEDIVINGNNDKSFVEMTLEDGFDGIYMDWVEAFSDENVIEQAEEEGVNPAEKMFDFIGKIKKYAQELSPNANADYLIVAQNAPDLYDKNPTRYVELMDAIAEEGVWYEGEADVSWSGSVGYNVFAKSWYPDWYTDVLQTLPKIKKHMPVFCIEYAQDLNGKNYATDVYENKAPAYGFIPYCSRRSLSQLSKTPYPKGYEPEDY